MISDSLWDLEEKIKVTNEEISKYLLDYKGYAGDQSPIIALLAKNEEHMKYLRDFRLQPGYDTPPKSLGK
jgi:hypothetical protein